MILIGQYDSPFVRRVGIALTLYGMAFEHRPWSAFGDADLLRALNPLTRVPTLVLDDGFVLVDSHMMLDYLDGLVDQPLFPRTEPARHRALKVAALACGLADKAVSLFYERAMHEVISPAFDARCRAQIHAVLHALEADLASRPGPYWFGDKLGHADIALGCALRFLREAHPGVMADLDFPTLIAFADRLEQTAVFAQISQPFLPPA
ncbi:MAG: glutathione S-transferase N-terminal domain-containing protein [Cypionkella sp.]|uniref:glutathione S-transferase family protein n=1 Tax=Cypionkella sp. TaxID=2811411 RepID=UPI002ABCFB98|nr:glutathione S-transferase N-terminal domain-containing protein [Cypionkella sp.]MDZ4312474.1 glutathione S-transferase N-terminal domain-containing protein [Cypionkella sp.]